MSKLIKNKWLLLFLILLGAFGLTFRIFAALELGWPPSPAGTQLTNNSTVVDLVQYFYEWGLAIGGIATFFVLLMAGFQYLTSAGDPDKMKEARDRIQSAIFGLILLLSSWLILNTINPELTTLKSPYFDPSDIPDISEDIVGAGEKPSCAYAVLYTGEKFTGDSINIDPNQSMSFYVIKDGKATKDVYHSIKAYYYENNILKECGSTACGCSLQLFSGVELTTDKKEAISCYYVSGFEICIKICTDQITTILAYNSKIEVLSDRVIRCTRLISPK